MIRVFISLALVGIAGNLQKSFAAAENNSNANQIAFCQGQRIAGLDLKAQIFRSEERLEVDLSGEDVDWCFADDGECSGCFNWQPPR